MRTRSSDDSADLRALQQVRSYRQSLGRVEDARSTTGGVLLATQTELTSSGRREPSARHRVSATSLTLPLQMQDLRVPGLEEELAARHRAAR